MARELISVIVPIYNVEEYLPRCIESIMEQTYKSIEILLVDDGSTDKSGEISDLYALQDERIKVIHKENGGVSSARNAGLDISKGAFICFVDSDDYIEPQFCQQLYETQIKHNADIVICSVQAVDEQYKVIRKSVDSDETKVYSGSDLLDMVASPQHPPKIIAPWCKLYRREIFDSVRFQEGIINEDEQISIHCYSRCSRVVFLNQVLYNYLVRSNSVTHRKIDERNLDIIEILIERAEFFYGLGKTKQAVQTYIYLFDTYSTYYGMFRNKNAVIHERLNRDYRRIVSGVRRVSFRDQSLKSRAKKCLFVLSDELYTWVAALKK